MNKNNDTAELIERMVALVKEVAIPTSERASTMDELRLEAQSIASELPVPVDEYLAYDRYTAAVLCDAIGLSGMADIFRNGGRDFHAQKLAASMRALATQGDK